jgi:nitrate/TMAO reductase-like tetraheme cytochrome c subunit
LKRKINWAIPGLAAMILIIAGVAWVQSQAATAPDPAKLATQCASCHTMTTYVETWQHSSHKDVACTACHADPGVMGWVQMQLGRVRMYFRENEVDLSQIATEVPNQRCLDCHARQMPWVMQDLKPPRLDERGEPIRPARTELTFLGAVAGHDIHLSGEKPLRCTDCHKGVSHGPGVEASRERAESWHEICLSCHAQEQVAVTVRNTISCSACHLDLARVAPADHRQADFRTLHGQAAKADITTCQQCHLNPGIAAGGAASAAGGAAQAGTGARQAATGTAPAAHGAGADSSAITVQFPPGSLRVPEGMGDACSACHGLTMPHPDGWLSRHAQGFQEKPELCASCHGTREQGFNLTFQGDPRRLSVENPSCTGCHAQPMPHPSGWAAAHQAAAKAAPQTCRQCHSPANPANPTAAHASPQFCLDCHLRRSAHPEGFVATHKDVLAKYGGDYKAAGCTQCHTETVNSCTTCHTAGVGQPQAWHPKDFVATHKDVLAKYGGDYKAAGCTQCHTETVNTCTTCHTAGVGQPQAWHPKDFVATHKDVLAKYGGDYKAAGCTQCHTETVNTCTACHTAGVGQPQAWHPERWWIKHAQVTKPSDRDSCNHYHAYVEPSCSTCHRNY